MIMLKHEYFHCFFFTLFCFSFAVMLPRRLSRERCPSPSLQQLYHSSQWPSLPEQLRRWYHQWHFLCGFCVFRCSFQRWCSPKVKPKLKIITEWISKWYVENMKHKCLNKFVWIKFESKKVLCHEIEIIIIPSWHLSFPDCRKAK